MIGRDADAVAVQTSVGTAATLARLVVATVFVVSAATKLLDFDGAANLLALMVPLPPAAARGLAAALVMGEATLAAGLLAPSPGWRRRAAVSAFAILILFTLAAGWLWSRGATDCGCFGAFASLSPRMTVAKNLALLATVGFLLRGRGGRPSRSREGET